MRLALVLTASLVLLSCGGRDDRETAEGSVCGVNAIKGTAIGNVSGKGVCGIKNAVQVTKVSGVTLSQPAKMNCETARSLNVWVAQSAKPAVARQGGGLKGLKVAAHYVCRTRNHKRGAKVSEHGKGRAIDLSAFYLADGSEISVLRDWGKGSKGKALRSMRKGACGPFGTVLGPGSDRYHRDHFHFDTAKYRSGPYCR